MSKTITTSAYGFFLLSPSVLDCFLKKKRIRKQNLLDLFQRNQDLFREVCIEQHIVLPLTEMGNYNYLLFINEQMQSLSHWENIYTYDGLQLEAGIDGLWIVSLEFFEHWKKLKEQLKGVTEISYIQKSGPHLTPTLYYYAHHINTPPGTKLISIKGFANRTATRNQTENVAALEISVSEGCENTNNHMLTMANFNIEPHL
ncbi:hypothetical protein [Treponema phagedenis]|uniref:hypothetical protein n=1 Tax=Treponema phagedenis TaxID=162 RepID=UPI0011E7254B|nr:hypothetical protein [Treponema phagedenis]QEK04614.1 hypothetical protein FUT83_12910 [Treponema phagedenis]QEK10270.1 hypothetical protein FUT81_13045 [Treponema phagedenis]